MNTTKVIIFTKKINNKQINRGASLYIYSIMAFSFGKKFDDDDYSHSTVGCLFYYYF